MAKSADWNRWRKWLEKNKIFFEVVVMVTLTFMSVLVGFSANNIANSQLRVEKLNHQPVFEFDSYSDSTNSFTWLSVHNTGFSVENIETCDPIVLLSLGFRNQDGSTNTKYFILEGYYDKSHVIGLTEDELFKFSNVWFDNTSMYSDNTQRLQEGNRFKYRELADELIDKDNDEWESSLHNINMHTFVHIKYTDMYGDTHEGFFPANELYRYKIHDSEFSALQKFIEGLEDEDYVIDLNNYSVETILQKASQQ